MKLSKKLSMFICVILTVSVFSGCSSSSKASGTSATKVAAKKRIYVIVKATDNSYWQTVKKGAADAATKDNMDISYVGAPGGESDINGEVALVETAINQKVDGIVLAASDSKALVPSIDKAVAAGIPVALIDSNCDTTKYISFATTNNNQAAYLVGKKLGELTGGKGTVAVVGYQPGAGSDIDREAGFKKAIAEFPGMKIVATKYSQSDPATALAVTEDILTSNPNITAIFAANEPSVAGAGRAIEEKKNKSVIFVGFDAGDDVTPFLKDGTLKATAVQMPYIMGQDAIEQLNNKFTNKPITKNIDTGVTIVTPSNMNDPASVKALNPLAK